MSSFFDGSHDSKKKVSLGGKSRGKAAESKNEFVERTRKEREEREAFRRRERSTLKLQAFVRGRKIASIYRGHEREGWDSAFESMASAWALQQPDAAAAAALARHNLSLLLRRLLFFFRHSPEDHNRLSRLYKWLVLGKAETSQGAPGLPLIIQCIAVQDQRESKAAFLRVNRLCSLSLERLVRMASEPPSDVHAIDAALLLRLSDHAIWGGEYTVNAPDVKLLEALVRGGLMKVVCAYVGGSDVPSSGQSHASSKQSDASVRLKEQLQLLLCGLVARSLGVGGMVIEGAVRMYVLDMMAKTLLSRNLLGQAKTVMEFKGLWPLVLTALSEDGGSLLREVYKSGHEGSASYLLANLVDLSSSSLAASTPAQTGMFAMCACDILLHIRQQRQPDTDDEMMVDNDDMVVETEVIETEVETAAGTARVQHTKVKRGGAHSVPHERIAPELATIKQHVQAMCNKEYVNKLLDVVLKARPPTSEGSAGSGVPTPAAGMGSLAASGQLPQEFVGVSGTCGLLLQLLDFLPTAKPLVINALAFKPKVLGMLWDWVRGVVPADSIRRGNPIPDNVLSPLLGLLTMFSLVYHYLLTTVDNTEFYERQYPFALSQVREMVQVLSGILHSLYWSTTPLSEAAKQFRHHGTKLLTRLFERNSHREFSARDSWIADPRRVSTVISELDSLLATRLSDPNEMMENLFEERHMAIMQSIPYALPFDVRVRILRHCIRHDADQVLDNPSNWVRCTVQRSQVLKDAYFELNPQGAAIKHTVQVTFVSEDGLVEAGIDGGGLFKEFLNSLAKQAFNPQHGLFCQTAEKLLFPNPQAETAHPWQDAVDHLRLLEFIGRMVGKAIYDGILIEVRLAPFFLRKMLGKEMYFDDLASLDPELYKNLVFVKNYAGDFEELGLNFAVTEDHYGVVKSTPLLPGGEDMAVTADNVLRYKNMVSDYWLNRRIKAHSQAFLKGLTDIVKMEWLRMFSPEELQMIISGSVKPIDVDDLRAHAVYGGGYTDDHPSVLAFWRVLKTLGNEDLERLLMFVTSCSRPPLLGFKELHPSFCIQKTTHTAEEADQRLPTASTCMNLLKLPSYTNDKDLRERLLYAVNAGAGFELS